MNEEITKYLSPREVDDVLKAFGINEEKFGTPFSTCSPSQEIMIKYINEKLGQK